jgi:hypothetical protein
MLNGVRVAIVIKAEVDVHFRRAASNVFKHVVSVLLVDNNGIRTDLPFRFSELAPVVEMSRLELGQLEGLVDLVFVDRPYPELALLEKTKWVILHRSDGLIDPLYITHSICAAAHGTYEKILADELQPVVRITLLDTTESVCEFAIAVANPSIECATSFSTSQAMLRTGVIEVIRSASALAKMNKKIKRDNQALIRTALEAKDVSRQKHME